MFQSFQGSQSHPDAQVESRLYLRKCLSSLCRRIQFPLQCFWYEPCQDGSGKAIKPVAAAAVPADAHLRGIPMHIWYVILKSNCSVLADRCTEVGAVAPWNKADFSFVTSVAVAQCKDLLCPVQQKVFITYSLQKCES